MLYVTIVDAEKRSKRSRHKTDDVGKAVADAVNKHLERGELRDTSVLGVVVERHRKAISDVSINQALIEVGKAKAF